MKEKIEECININADPENAYDDYIKGIRSFADVSDDYKH